MVNVSTKSSVESLEIFNQALKKATELTAAVGLPKEDSSVNAGRKTCSNKLAGCLK